MKEIVGKTIVKGLIMTPVVILSTLFTMCMINSVEKYKKNKETNVTKVKTTKIKAH